MPDREWDAFVDSVPGGQYVQTSAWAEVKATVGWQAARIVVRERQAVVAGCQLLIRPVPLLGAIASVPRGPVALEHGPDLLHVVLSAVDRLARERRLALCQVQPPRESEAMTRALTAHGFRPSELAAAPTTTVRIDLDRPQDEIWRSMRPGVRSNIGKARRRGVHVRSGGDDDMDAFHSLVLASSGRQGFSTYPRHYYEAIWCGFGRGDRARILLAEHQGRPLAGLLLVGYGDTVTYVMGGWSGERTGIHPTELAHWAGIEWARTGGYKYYDFGGIDVAVANAILAGEVRRRDVGGVAAFKLGFGGEVARLPGAYDGRYRFLLPAVMEAARARLPLGRLVDRLAGRGG